MTAAIEKIVWRDILRRLDRGPVSFIQVGAHDGQANDPLYPAPLQDHWSGILLEPVPFLFERLRSTYSKARNLTLLNCAVSVDRDGDALPFFRVRALGQAPTSWYDQLSSFDRDVIMKHRGAIPDLESLIEETTVPCRTLAGLIEELKIRDLSLLLVDTEGWDGRIVRSFPFQSIKPRAIWYEHRHMHPDDAAATRFCLHQQGYELLRFEEDDCALDASLMTGDEARLLRALLEVHPV